MKEPEKWVLARAEGRRTGVAFGFVCVALW